MAARADFKVQFGLGRTGLPRGAARAADVNRVILRVDAFSHGVVPLFLVLFQREPPIIACATARGTPRGPTGAGAAPLSGGKTRPRRH